MSIYQPISDQTSVLPTEVTVGLWSPDDTGSLGAIFTSSRQVAIAGEFFYDAYNLNPADTANNAEAQFSVAYGHVNGGGSPSQDNNVLNGNSLVPTKVIYTQYRNVLLTSGSKFTFGTGTSAVVSDDIYVININRARLKQALDAGNWQLALSGSNGIRTFVDTSNLGNISYGNVIASTVYDIRSGSLTGVGAVTASSDTTVYGLAFPDYGVLVLHPSAISSSVGFSGSNGAENLDAITNISGPFAPYTGSAATDYQYQHEALFRSISGSMMAGKPFIARSAEIVNSRNYSVTLTYDKFNFTNNPTYYDTVDGVRTVKSAFQNNPITYITTIGLYNSNDELVAVAKLSRPLQKSKDKTALIRVRLDY